MNDPVTLFPNLLQPAAKNYAPLGVTFWQGEENLLAGMKEFADGWFVEPTVIENVRSGSSLACDELFGPVLAVQTFADADDAIAMANDTEYGLHASVFTSNLRTAHLAARAIQAGTVSVNSYSEGDVTTPFGGYKLSGFGGRDKGVHALEQYTEVKTIWVDLS